MGYKETHWYTNWCLDVCVLARVLLNKLSMAPHSSTLVLIGPTCLEDRMVWMLMTLSSSSCWMSSIPPRMNTSFWSLKCSTENSIVRHESMTCCDKVNIYFNLDNYNSSIKINISSKNGHFSLYLYKFKYHYQSLEQFARIVLLNQQI